MHKNHNHKLPNSFKVYLVSCQAFHTHHADCAKSQCTQANVFDQDMFCVKDLLLKSISCVFFKDFASCAHLPKFSCIANTK